MEEIHLEPFWFSLLRKGDIRELWHPELEVIFILKGKGSIFFSDLKTAYTLQEKDIFVVNSFEVHEFELEHDSVALSFMISPEFVNHVAPELLRFRIDCRSFLHVKEQQPIFDLLRRDLACVFQEHYKSEPGTGYLKSKAAVVLGDIGKYFLNKQKAVENRGMQESMKHVTRYIQQHYQEHLTLEELAKHTFLSKTYISRSFPRYLGISFTGYLELLRLSSAISMLDGKENLTQIAENSGFPNVNAMIQAFRRYWGITPGEYRRNREKRQGKIGDGNTLEEGNGLFHTLMEYVLKTPDIFQKTESVQEIAVDASGKKQPLSAHWKRLMNVGYARSLLDGRIQRELREIQGKIRFEYLRIKGILDDDMCLLRRDMHGKLLMNYACVDEGIDFILSVGAKPMLEFSMMPGVLASHAEAFSMRGEIISGPRDLRQWSELIRQLMQHLVERYGREKVETWLFVPWMSPDFADIGYCSLEEYAQVYTTSFSAIRQIVPRALIAGPGSVSFSRCFSWYLQMCRENDCMPDVLTFRSFATAGAGEEDEMNLIGNNESFPYAVSGDPDFLAHETERIRQLMKEERMENMPLILEEWSNNIWQRDLCNDTCYKSAYLFKNILENNQNLSAMGYFSLNDRLDEVPPVYETFHGGFGLYTQNDIPKSSCLAMELLAQMGDKLLAQGDGYLVSQRGQELQIFFYYYSHYDLLYRYRHVVNMGRTNRDQVFVNQESRAFYLRIKNLPEGTYTIRSYGITREWGSSYDEWVRMGAPNPMNQEEEERLRRMACPKYHSGQLETINGELHIKESLSPQDVWLIRIKGQPSARAEKHI